MSFIPKEFQVPAALDTSEFRLRILSVNDVVKDFDAVMTSVDHCKTIWGGKWPEGLTLEQNLIDLGWHQKEFQTRRSLKDWISTHWPFNSVAYPGRGISLDEWRTLPEEKK